jgi:hypothetical protein
VTETSALDAFIRARKPDFDMAEYRAALASDWERGRPEQIAAFDCELGMSGGLIRGEGYTGYVGTMRADGTPLTEFRSIVASGHSKHRHVFAKDVDGAVWYVGKIRQPHSGGSPMAHHHRRRYRRPETCLTPEAQAEIDRILAMPGPVHVGTWKGD